MIICDNEGHALTSPVFWSDWLAGMSLSEKKFFFSKKSLTQLCSIMCHVARIQWEQAIRLLHFLEYDLNLHINTSVGLSVSKSVLVLC